MPTLNIPIAIPVTVRTATDYGLRFNVSDITQLTPLSERQHDDLGLPGRADSTTRSASPAGSPGEPAGCPGLADTSCNASPTKPSIPNHPFTDNPTPAAVSPGHRRSRSRPTRTPATSRTPLSSYPAIEGCEQRDLQTAPAREPDHRRNRLAVGTRPQPAAPSSSRAFAASPSEIKSAVVTLPRGPDDQPRRGRRPERLHRRPRPTSAPRAPPNAPTTRRSGPLSSARRPSTAASRARSTSANRSRATSTGSSWSSTASACTPSWSARSSPDPVTGQVTAYFEDLPQVPFEDFDIHLFASDRGLLATPTHCTHLRPSTRALLPLERHAARLSTRRRTSASLGARTAPLPGAGPSLPPAPRGGNVATRIAGAFSNFHLKLDRDDGDQFLGDLNFRMPPGFTGDLRGISYCPEAAILAAAPEARPGRAGDPELSRLLADRDDQRRRRARAAIPFHAVGKMYLSGPFKGRRSASRRSRRRWPGPTTTASSSSASRCTSTRSPRRSAPISDTVPQIIGGVPIRMRSIQVNIDKPNFTINPTNCSTFTVDSQGIGDQGTVADFFSSFTRGQLRLASPSSRG